MTTEKKVGRPRKPDEQLTRPRQRRDNYRNITLDADVLEAIDELKKRMAQELGFTPTHSQVVKYAINKVMVYAC
jgi:hypothetical protein